MRLKKSVCALLLTPLGNLKPKLDVISLLFTCTEARVFVSQLVYFFHFNIKKKIFLIATLI